MNNLDFWMIKFKFLYCFQPLLPFTFLFSNLFINQVSILSVRDHLTYILPEVTLISKGSY